MAIVLRVHELLKAKGWTAYRLAKEAGISLTLAYRLAKPRARFQRYEAETLEKLCVALRCDVGDILHWDKKYTPRRARWR